MQPTCIRFITQAVHVITRSQNRKLTRTNQISQTSVKCEKFSKRNRYFRCGTICKTYGHEFGVFLFWEHGVHSNCSCVFLASCRLWHECLSDGTCLLRNCTVH